MNEIVMIYILFFTWIKRRGSDSGGKEELIRLVSAEGLARLHGQGERHDTSLTFRGQNTTLNTMPASCENAW